MYKTIQTPHSPLSPLPPRIRSSEYLVEKTPNIQYLTPSYPTKISHQPNKRRLFTPSAFDNVPPPSVSPIQKVYESPESDLENAAILKKPVSSATKLTELMSAANTPHQLSILIDRKSHSCSANRKGSGKIGRAYHRQRKNENRPSMNIDITSLRRSLYQQMQSPSMLEQSGKNSVTWNDSPTMFDSTMVTVKRGSQPKPEPSVPLINLYTPEYVRSTNEYVQPRNDGNDSSQLSDNSILNNNLSIESVLKDIGMKKYIEKFQLEEIDLFVFFHLQPEDLFELNIDEKDHETLLQAIKVYAI